MERTCCSSDEGSQVNLKFKPNSDGTVSAQWSAGLGWLTYRGGQLVDSPTYVGDATQKFLLITNANGTVSIRNTSDGTYWSVDPSGLTFQPTLDHNPTWILQYSEDDYWGPTI